MEVYYIGLILLTVLWLLTNKGNSEAMTQRHGLWCFCAWLILGLIEGLRSFDLGTDTSTYAYLFETDAMNAFEAGFQLIGKVVHLVTNDPVAFILAISLVTNGLIIFSIYKISTQPYVSVFCYVTLYYYFQSFNAMRQYLAIGIILVAYSYLRQNRLFRYIIGTILAILFHSSGIAGFLLLPYHFFKISNRGLSGVLKSLIFPLFLGILITTIFNIGLDFLLMIFPKYSIYLQRDEFEGLNVVQQIVVNSAIFLAYVLFTTHREFVLPLGTAVALSFMISFVGLMMRFVWFFDIFSIFAIAEIWNTKLFEAKSKFLLRCAILITCLSFMTYYLYMNVMKVADYSFSIF